MALDKHTKAWIAANIKSKKARAGVKKCLTESMKLIEEVGWVKGEEVLFDDESGQPKAYCMIGAIHEADGAYEDLAGQLLAAIVDPSAVEKIYDDETGFIAEQGIDKGVNYSEIELNWGTIVPDYNDKKSRKKAEVIQKFKEAIKSI